MNYRDLCEVILTRRRHLAEFSVSYQKITKSIDLPKNTAALAMAFLVCPPTFPETSERPTTNVALDAPVIPYVLCKYWNWCHPRKLTESDESGCFGLRPCDHGKANNSGNISNDHQPGAVSLWQLRIRPNGGQNTVTDKIIRVKSCKQEKRIRTMKRWSYRKVFASTLSGTCQTRN